MKQEAQKEYNSNRNVGIDLLKILAMFMIVCLHMLGHGGVLEASETLTVSHYSAWFLESAVFCSVNCYALVSGYVYYGRRLKCSNIIYLLLQVLFYTVVITAVFLVFKNGTVGAKDILKAIFPWGFGTYWYFSAYFVLFFFIPFFNKALEVLSKKEMISLLGTIFMLLSVFPTLFHYDYPKVNNGYSFLWLAVMYLFGGFVKKYRIIGFNNNKNNFLVYVLCVLVAWLSKLCIDISTSYILGSAMGGSYLISFTSPLIVIAAVFLFIFFLRLSPGKLLTRIAELIAPLTFGVYLLHEEPLIRQTLVKNKLAFLVEMNPFIMIVSIIGISIAIFIVGIIIDRIRLWLFSIIKIRELSSWFGRKANCFSRFILNRFQNTSDGDV